MRTATGRGIRSKRSSVSEVRIMMIVTGRGIRRRRSSVREVRIMSQLVVM